LALAANGGQPKPYAYSGAALYPPFAYLVPGAAMAVAEAFGARELNLFYVGRFANALLFSTVCAIAIMLAAELVVPTLFLLMLPMTIFQAGSLSADGFVVACTLLACALLAAHSGDQASGQKQLYTAAFLIFVAATTKLPLIFLSIPLGVVAWQKSRRQVAILLVSGVLAGAIIWVLLMAPVNNYMNGRPSSIGGQIGFVISNPAVILSIVHNTIADFGRFYYISAIGILGWLDTPLSVWYYVFAGIFSILFAGLATTGSSTIASRGIRGSFTIASVLGILATFLILYLVWTPVGVTRVEGVQGRYLIPLAIPLVFSIRGLLSTIRIPTGFILFLEVFFLIVGYLQATMAILLRYYV
jgi:uncharacterized membrane protein